MPWRTISGGERPARSILLSRMRPRSGLSAPVMRLKNVLFPAPLGPMTAVSEPSAKLNEISSAALTPPNDFESCWISSMLPSRRFSPRATRLVPVDSEVHQPSAQADREEQDHDPEHDAVIFGQARNRIIEDQQQHGADHGPKEGGDAAEHVDEDPLP